MLLLLHEALTARVGDTMRLIQSFVPRRRLILAALMLGVVWPHLEHSPAAGAGLIRTTAELALVYLLLSLRRDRI